MRFWKRDIFRGNGRVRKKKKPLLCCTLKMITSSQNICFRKKDIYFQTGSKQELNYTYKISIMITLLTAFYTYLCIVKSFK